MSLQRITINTHSFTVVARSLLLPINSRRLGSFRKFVRFGRRIVIGSTLPSARRTKTLPESVVKQLKQSLSAFAGDAVVLLETPQNC